MILEGLHLLGFRGQPTRLYYYQMLLDITVLLVKANTTDWEDESVFFHSKSTSQIPAPSKSTLQAICISPEKEIKIGYGSAAEKSDIWKNLQQAKLLAD
jgi:hypothetical protein